MARPKNLPAAPEAEICVLSAMLLDEDAVAHALEQLTARDFSVPRYGLVFDAMADIHRRGGLVDPPTLIDALVGTKVLTAQEAGGFIADLLDAVPTAANVKSHVRDVRDRATRRALYDAAIYVAEQAQDATLPDLTKLLDRAERRIFDVARDTEGDGPIPVRKLVGDAFVTIEQGGPKGLPTGFANLDRRLKGHGLHGGQLVVVAGRTAMGKSVFGGQVALHAAIDRGVPTLFVSLEMTRDELVLRALAAEACVSLERMLDGQVTGEDEMDRLRVAAARLHPAPLFIDDRPAQSILEIRSKARRAKAEHGIGLIVLDYLQYVVAEGETRQQQVGAVSRGLKALAKELGVPVVALAQLSREPEKRADKRPQLSDLREAGDIEQDADVVILLHRPEYYFGQRSPDGKDLTGRAEAIIGKQRNGPTGSVDLYFRAEAVRFEDADWSADR